MEYLAVESETMSHYCLIQGTIQRGLPYLVCVVCVFCPAVSVLCGLGLSCVVRLSLVLLCHAHGPASVLGMVAATPKIVFLTGGRK